MGDSNLHLNISVRQYNKEVEKAIEPWVYEWIQKRNGSISAEHGLGLAKKEFIGYSQNDTMLKLMKQLKALYDPVSLAHFNTFFEVTNNGLEWYYEPLQVHLGTKRLHGVNSF
jgi:hypothetical protein